MSTPSTPHPNQYHLLGQTFGYLTVKEQFRMGVDNRIHWKCLCVCGRSVIRRPDNLLSGRTRKLPKPPSCGKCNDETSFPLVHAQWRYVVQACYNTASSQWKKVGRVGIRIDPSWRHDFKAFHIGVGDPPQDGMRYRIERVNPAGDFTKENCVWKLSPRRYQPPQVKANHVTTAEQQTTTCDN